MKVLTRIGFRYKDGKIWLWPFHKSANPGKLTADDAPKWSVDIREIIAMVFVGSGAMCLLWKGDTQNAMILLTGLLSYATGRTVAARS